MTTVHGLAMQVSTRRIDDKTCLKYTYTTPGRDGMRLTFYTLNEVAERHKKQAKMLRDHLAAQAGMVVRAQNLEVKPWVADTLVTQEEADTIDASRGKYD